MSKHGAKGKANLPAGGFVPLGRDNTSDISSSRIKSQTTSKKELQASGGILKRARVNFGSAVPSTSAALKRYTHNDANWRKFCAETKVDAKNVLASLESAFEKQKPHKAGRIVCAVVREFMDYRGDAGTATIDPLLISALYLFVKRNSAFLLQAEVVDALCSMLTAGFPASSPGFSFASSLLYSILRDSQQWNWVLVDCFIDDSLHERRWVDSQSSSALVANLITAFGTQIPPETMYSSCELRYPERFLHIAPPLNRFADATDKRAKLSVVIDNIREVCERKGESAPKSLLKTMCSCSGCPEVRLIASRKIDAWLQNGKLQRHAMELMLWIAWNIGANFAEDDTDSLNNLLKLRSLKSKQINALFNVALREILNSDSDVLSIIMKLLLANEFSSNRFPFNMAIIHTLFSFDAVTSSKVLAREISSVLAAKEEYLRVTRIFLREFARSLMRVHFDFVLFTEHLFVAVVETFDTTTIPDFMFKSLVDVCAFLPFISMPPAVREALQVKRGITTNSAQSNMDAVKSFHADLLKFFEICADFLAKYHDLCKDVGPQPQPARLFVYSYYRLFYFAPVEYYSSIDGWPAEAEATQYIRAFSEAPLSEKLLLSVLEAASDQLVPIEAPDAIDLVQNFTKRAYLASAVSGNSALVPISKVATIETLFKTTFYRPPSKFQIPLDELPSLAVKLLYWNAWLITVMWVALNKGTLIKQCYAEFPTLKIILQMILTRDYRYPPSSMDSEDARKLLDLEDREMVAERETVKKLEARLAGYEVNENESMLLGKLCILAPRDVSRRPSDDFIRDLAKLNDELDLSRSLSECRDPDLLSDIIRSQGSVQALRPILTLVESNENAITYLPLECICELFVHCLSSSLSSAVNKDKKLSVEKLCIMRNRLRASLRGSDRKDESVIRVLEYFISRLGASTAVERMCAAHALSLFLQPDVNALVLPVNGQSSFTKYLHLVTGFDQLKQKICCWIAQLCPVETDVKRLSEYIEFLIEYVDLSTIHLIACHLSSSVDRFEGEFEDDNICNLALCFFEKYFISAQKDEAKWTESVEASLPSHAKKVIVIKEENGQEVTKVELVSCAVCGIIQLLCGRWDNSDLVTKGKLMDIWFPLDGPKLKLEIVNGNREELLPAGLKLKMVTSVEKRIADFALDEILHIEDAVKYIKSYGLTEYSCTRILKILDEYDGPLDGHLFDVACDAIPFVISYQKKGNNGGDKFLRRLQKQRLSENTVKMELDESEYSIILDPPPYTETVIEDQKHWRSMRPEEAVSCFETILTLKEPVISDWVAALCRIGEDVSVARAAVSLLRRKPALAANEKIMSCFLLAVHQLQMKACLDSALREDLIMVSNLVNKKPSVPEGVKVLLRNIGKDTGRESTELKNKQLIEVTEHNAAALLLQLAEPGVSDERESVLLHEFLCRCPELIPICKDENESLYSPALYQIIGILFSTTLPVFDYIISLMPVRCSPSTISKILSCLLESHNSSLSSRSIMAAVISSLNLARPFPLTRGHCAVLVEYILDELQRDYSTMARMTSFLDTVAKHHEDLVCVLFSTFSEILTSSAQSVRQRLVKQLVIKFRTMYPDVTMENDVISVNSLSTTKDLDGFVRALFLDLFAAASENSEKVVDEKVTAIRQFASCRPHVLIRHLALISGLLSSVVWLSVKELKNKYQKILALIPELLLSFSPQVFDEPRHVKAVLQHFFYFFEKIGRSRAWNALAVTIIQVCEQFLRVKGKDARPYLVMHQEVIEFIASFAMQHPSSRVVIDAIVTATDQIETSEYVM